MKEMRECPFCGSNEVDLYRYESGNKCVVCYKCYASSGNYMTDDMAIEAWNRTFVRNKAD